MKIYICQIFTDIKFLSKTQLLMKTQLQDLSTRYSLCQLLTGENVRTSCKQLTKIDLSGFVNATMSLYSTMPYSICRVHACTN